MNEICKENIRTRLRTALDKEGLPVNTAGGMLKIAPSYLSMVKNPVLWHKVSQGTWDKLLLWVNSGKKIVDYHSSENVASEEKTPTMPSYEEIQQEYHNEAVEKDKKPISYIPEEVFNYMEYVPTKEGIVPVENAVVPKTVKSVPEPIKSVPKPKSTVKKESQPTHVSDARLVFLLMEERSCLVAGINAIDALLKMYAK